MDRRPCHYQRQFGSQKNSDSWIFAIAIFTPDQNERGKFVSSLLLRLSPLHIFIFGI